MDYYGGNLIGAGWDPKQVAGWGSGEMQNSSVQQAQMATQLFQQQFQNLLGRAPTPQELGAFQSQVMTGAINQPGDLNYGDASGLANSYIQNAFGPQAAAYQQQQQMDQLGKSQSMVQDLINKTMSNTASQFKDPNSQLYQQFAGGMNNMGITPGSGAFQAGAGSTIANSGMQAANQGLMDIGIPGIQSIAQVGQNPYQQSFGSGANALQHQQGLSDFNLQSQIAQMLQQQMEPSAIQKDIGMAAGAGQAVGGLGQGMAGAAQLTWICTAMWRAKVLAAFEVDRLHKHLFQVFLKRPFKFLGYFLIGKLVVLWAERKGVIWEDWRPMFYDRVIAEPDPLKALSLYEDAFWELKNWCASLVYDKPLPWH